MHLIENLWKKLPVLIIVPNSECPNFMRHLFNSHCINKALWAFDVSEDQAKCFVAEI